MSIRDNFDAPECALRQELQKLNSEVGYTFTISLAWSDIHRDLSPFFPDLSIMVPSVVSAITIYLRRLLVLLQNDDFQEAFLDKMKGSTSIIIRVGEQKSEDRSSFDIHGRLVFTLPAEGGKWFRGMTARIGHDLEEVFMNPDKSSEANVDWVDVPATAAKVRMTGEAVAASLPPMSTLSKPESLFPTLLPYFVIISASGTTIHIESAHQPTLTLLHRYLSAHVRKDLNTTTQVLNPSFLLLPVAQLLHHSFQVLLLNM
jgi:hypothetical protein